MKNYHLSFQHDLLFYFFNFSPTSENPSQKASWGVKCCPSWGGVVDFLICLLVLSILGETKRAKFLVVHQHEHPEGHDIVQSNLSSSWIAI